MVFSTTIGKRRHKLCVSFPFWLFSSAYYLSLPIAAASGFPLMAAVFMHIPEILYQSIP